MSSLGDRLAAAARARADEPTTTPDAGARRPDAGRRPRRRRRRPGAPARRASRPPHAVPAQRRGRRAGRRPARPRRPRPTPGAGGAPALSPATQHGPDRGAQGSGARRAAQAARPAALRRRHGPGRARPPGARRPRRTCWPRRTGRSATATATRITQEISDDILGYGPIEPFLRDPDVTEVMVNGPDSIWLERKRPADAGRRARSPTRRTCAARSTRSCPASAAASTSPARWWTPGSPTAAVSTPSSRRWRSTAPR